MEKRWKLLEADTEITNNLRESLNIHPLLCQLLALRGIKTFEEARDFFRPHAGLLHSPWLMKDMRLAVNRISLAVIKGEPILVFGDYDVDGTTAVSVMYRFLKDQGARVSFYIPHRYREGYGVSKAGIDHAHANGQSLVIALDCGIKSVELIRYAITLGIDFIVCDHHLPDEELPPAHAILNPKQPLCSYPYNELCGCGVGFKLISALAEEWKLPEEATHQYLDLVATAIAADIVPITGENRVLAFLGLKKAQTNPNFGIKALAALSGMQGTMDISRLVFMIAPRVNAAGRMDDGTKAVQMFVAENYEEAYSYAEQLHSDNTGRKETDSSITTEALELIKELETGAARRSTVVYREHWHKGVVGIVASRLIEHYYRPTVVLTRSGDIVAGSARSVNGFNLYEAIHSCREHLLGYGGHFHAAGMTLLPEQVDAFCEKFEEVVAATIHADSLLPELILDGELKLSDINIKLYNIITQMEPFGPGNMQPLFLVRGVVNTGYSKIVKEQHLKISVRQDNVVMSGIGFGLADRYPLLQSGKPVDLAVKIDLNEWNGERRLQLRVEDVREVKS